MLRSSLEILSSYLKQPARALSHASKASRIIKSDGVNHLLKLISLRLEVIEIVRSAASQSPNVPPQLGGSQGTILIVCHDAEVGGAQTVAKTFASWITKCTAYDVRFVVIRGGCMMHSFAEIAPTLNLEASQSQQEDLQNFAGEDVKAIFINSVASGSFLKFWTRTTPIIAFIHELPKLLRIYSKELSDIIQRADLIIGGSRAVSSVLHSQFGVPATKLETVCAFVEDFAEESLGDFDEKNRLKESLGLDPNTALVTACGVLHWRKSPEKFIEIARRVLATGQHKVRFIWIGSGPDHIKCEEMIANLGLSDSVTITGYQPDILKYLKASDIFLLPSQEDPFPLVCLYAALTLNPIVCFRDAGGMPELVEQGCGHVIPFDDITGMTNAVTELLHNKSLRQQFGVRGRELVLKHHTAKRAGPHLFHLIRRAANLKPRVSVIVPNYNHAAFLPDRLSSLANQTFQDFEVLLLDDKSADDSVEILSDWSRTRPGTKLITNEANSGSPFAQWLLGMRESSADLIWVAESDDTCEPTFLATLVPQLDDKNVFLAQCCSVPVDKTGRPLGDYQQIYLSRISEDRWRAAYIATDHEEANAGLGIANSIPNASSVVFRRFDPEPEFVRAVSAMRMCGDWYFYLRALRGGLISYCADKLNYHRRHGDSVTTQTQGSPVYFDELAEIRAWVAQNYQLSSVARAKIDAFTLQDLARFAIVDDLRRKSILELTNAASPAKRRLPSVLFVVSDLGLGGGQLFCIKLANAWRRRGGRCAIYNVGRYSSNDKVAKLVDAGVPIFDRSSRIEFSDIVARFDFEVIHSSLWWADKFVLDQVETALDVPWVVTMHGCYETLIDRPEIDLIADAYFPRLLSRVDCWVSVADKNRRLFELYGEPKQERRVANGAEAVEGEALPRDKLGLRPSANALCLVARAIPEKGWLEAVEICETLNRDGYPTDLMLIGDGPVVAEIKRRNPPFVRCYGHVSNVQDYISSADIGLIPTTFIGESMPLAALEMMSQGKPIITTDLGQLPELVGSDAEACGMVVPRAGGKVDVGGFVSAVKHLSDARLRHSLGAKALERFQRDYTIDRMLERYMDLYHHVLD